MTTPTQQPINKVTITRVDWMATLRAIKVGDSATFHRHEITVPNLRSKCSQLKRYEGLKFIVKSIDNDDAAIVTREK